MPDYALIAKYPQQQVCRDRTYQALLEWAAYQANQPIPTEKPTEDWVAIRVTAEKIPADTLGYVGKTINYYPQFGDIQTNIRQFLTPFNDEATEVSLCQQLGTITATFMPNFAMRETSQNEIDNWYLDHGFTVEVTPINPAIGMPMGRMPRPPM